MVLVVNLHVVVPQVLEKKKRFFIKLKHFKFSTKYFWWSPFYSAFLQIYENFMIYIAKNGADDSKVLCMSIWPPHTKKLWKTEMIFHAPQTQKQEGSSPLLFSPALYVVVLLIVFVFMYNGKLYQCLHVMYWHQKQVFKKNTFYVKVNLFLRKIFHGNLNEAILSNKTVPLRLEFHGNFFLRGNWP